MNKSPFQNKADNNGVFLTISKIVVFAVKLTQFFPLFEHHSSFLWVPAFFSWHDLLNRYPTSRMNRKPWLYSTKQATSNDKVSLFLVISVSIYIPE
jgi:hypothetical protein